MDLNQTFLYKGNFQDIKYPQLCQFAEQKINRQLNQHYFKYQLADVDLKISTQELLEQIQELVAGQTTVKLYLIEQEQPKQQSPQVHQQQPQQQIKVDQQQQPNDKVVHPNTQCSQCNQSPIMDIRYKCMVCQNMDLCGDCLEHRHIHPLMMISTPEQIEYTISTIQKSASNVFNFLKKSVCSSKEKFNQITSKINPKQDVDKLNESVKMEKSSSIETRLLRLSELLEGDPQQYRQFVESTQNLTMQEMLEQAIERYG